MTDPRNIRIILPIQDLNQSQLQPAMDSESVNSSNYLYATESLKRKSYRDAAFATEETTQLEETKSSGGGGLDPLITDLRSALASKGILHKDEDSEEDDDVVSDEEDEPIPTTTPPIPKPRRMSQIAKRKHKDSVKSGRFSILTPDIGDPTGLASSLMPTSCVPMDSSAHHPGMMTFLIGLSIYIVLYMYLWFCGRAMRMLAAVAWLIPSHIIMNRMKSMNYVEAQCSSDNKNESSLL